MDQDRRLALADVVITRGVPGESMNLAVRSILISCGSGMRLTRGDDGLK